MVRHCHIRPNRFPFVSTIQSGEASDIICFVFDVRKSERNWNWCFFSDNRQLTAKIPPTENSPALISDNRSISRRCCALIKLKLSFSRWSLSMFTFFRFFVLLNFSVAHFCRAVEAVEEGVLSNKKFSSQQISFFTHKKIIKAVHQFYMEWTST